MQRSFHDSLHLSVQICIVSCDLARKGAFDYAVKCHLPRNQRSTSDDPLDLRALCTGHFKDVFLPMTEGQKKESCLKIHSVQVQPKHLL